MTDNLIVEELGLSPADVMDLAAALNTLLASHSVDVLQDANGATAYRIPDAMETVKWVLTWHQLYCHTEGGKLLDSAGGVELGALGRGAQVALQVALQVDELCLVGGAKWALGWAGRVPLPTAACWPGCAGSPGKPPPAALRLACCRFKGLSPEDMLIYQVGAGDDGCWGWRVLGLAGAHLPGGCWR